jgi:hypothetical protein
MTNALLALSEDDLRRIVLSRVAAEYVKKGSA